MNYRIYKIISMVAIGVLMSFSFASAKNFTIYNATNINQPYFSVNGTSGNVGIGLTNPSSPLQMLNNSWISARNAAGTGAVNMFKINANDQIEVGAPLNIGSFEFSPDSGLVTFVDMPVSATPTIGTPEGYVFKADGDNIMTIYSEANGFGGVQNKRIGIGLTNPLGALHVAGTENVIFNTTGNLGISTTSPVAKLAVSAGTGNAIYAGGGQVAGLNLTPINPDHAVPLAYLQGNYAPIGSGAGSAFVQGGNSFGGIATLGTNDNNLLNIETNSTTRMTIAANGNVGIGTTTPVNLLQLSSGTKTAYFSLSGNPLLMVGGATDYGASIQLNNGRIQFGRDGGSGGGYFHNNDSGMRAQMANSFWIHNTSFSVASEDQSNATGGSVKGGLRLQTVFADTASDSGLDKIALRLRVTDGGTGNKYLMSLQNGLNTQLSVKLDGTTYFAGNVGIGTSSPSDKLQVMGNIGYSPYSAIYPRTSVISDWYLNKYVVDGSEFIDNALGAGRSFRIGKYSGGIFTPNVSLSGGIVGSNSYINVGNFGVGTTNPTSTLQVSGGTGDVINVSGGQVAGLNLTPLNPDHAVPLAYLQGNYAPIGSGAGSAFVQGGNSFGGIATLGTNDNNLLNIETNSTTRMTIAANGNVGIGTTSPSQKLDVVGTVTATSLNMGQLWLRSGNEFENDGAAIYIQYNTGRPVQIGSAINSSLDIYGNTSIKEDNDSLYIGAGSDLRLYHNGTNSLITNSTGYLDINSAGNTVFSGGKVGIGTTSPVAPLSVHSASGEAIRVNNQISGLPSPTNPDHAVNKQYVDNNFSPIGSTSKWASSSNNIYNINSGNVGIGTTTPGAKLDVNGIYHLRRPSALIDAGSTLGGAIIFANTDLANDANGYFQLSYPDKQTVRLGTAFDGNLTGSIYRDIQLGRFNNPYITIKDGGSVGIGTTTPGSKFHIYESSASSPSGLMIGESTLSTANSIAGFRLSTWSDGNAYFDTKTYTGKSLNFRIGEGTQFGSNKTWMMVSGASGNIGIGTTTAQTAKLYISGGAITDSEGSGATLSANGLFMDSDEISTTGNTLNIGNSSSVFKDINISRSLFVKGAANGFIGIGTSSPIAKLAITSAGTTSGRAFTVADSSNKELLNIFDSGNIGIGLTNPSDVLQIHKDQADFSGIRLTNAGTMSSNTRAGIRFGEATNSDYAEISWLRSGYDEFRIENKVTATGDITFRTGGFERLKIDQSGNVGINTTTPVARLAIASGTSNVLYVGGGQIGGLNSVPTNNDHAVSLGYLNSIIGNAFLKGGNSFGSVSALGTNDNYRLDLETNNVTRMTIANDGNVGIGTTGPSRLFHIYSSGTSQMQVEGSSANTSIQNGQVTLIFKNSDATNNNWESLTFQGANGTVASLDVQNINHASSYGELNFSTRGADGYVNRLIVKSNGNIGIGTTNPGAKLEVNGDLKLSGTGKLTANTIDPPYFIDGRKYATYMAGMTGVKEETTGVVKLRLAADKSYYYHVLDIGRAEEGSDLWLFGRTANLKQNGLNAVTVLLAPSFSGRVWYEKDSAKQLITIKASGLKAQNNLEVSYRLSAPRFDTEEYGNRRPDSDPHEGINLDKLLK